MPGINAFQEALKTFLFLEPSAVAMASGALYDEKKGVFLLDYCGRKYEIQRSTGAVSKVASKDGVPYNDRTLILQYLVLCSGLPPRGRWLSFLELPEGIH
ncbi:MAG: DUF3786 domain-containing protein, partial [Firmicutes bacterium]|nr:DUF3786 domain-containing protein [Bacillota bacterium]